MDVKTVLLTLAILAIGFSLGWVLGIRITAHSDARMIVEWIDAGGFQKNGRRFKITEVTETGEATPEPATAEEH